MRNRVILFAIGAEVMDNEWGLTHVAGENHSIPISYDRETGYLLKSCLTTPQLPLKIIIPTKYGSPLWAWMLLAVSWLWCTRGVRTISD
jgi:hypothetical protein